MKLCLHCGRPADQHCPGFEVRKLPDGCKCDDESWGNSVTPICGHYEPENGYEFCRNCEHDKECHSA